MKKVLGWIVKPVLDGFNWLRHYFTQKEGGVLTDSDLLDVWQEYMESISQRRVLVNRKKEQLFEAICRIYALEQGHGYGPPSEVAIIEAIIARKESESGG